MIFSLANMTECATVYAELPLTSHDSIRVLSITKKGSYSDDEGVLNGELRVIQLNEDPEFDALSIARPEKGALKIRKIRCHGHEVYISDNCHDALANLQRHKRTLTIFVPTVCVDQDSESEKEHHVALARKLYSAAKNTYIWLGDGSPATDEAINLFSAGRGLRHIFYKNGDPSSGQTKWLISVYMRLLVYPWVLSRPTEDSLRLNTHAGKSVSSLRSLTQLLDSSWTSCIWTLQDVVLATSPIVIHGDCHILWIDFATTILYLYQVRAYDKVTAYDKDLRVKLELWVELIICKDHINARRDFHVKGSSRGVLTRCVQLLDDIMRIHRKGLGNTFYVFMLFLWSWGTPFWTYFSNHLNVLAPHFIKVSPEYIFYIGTGIYLMKIHDYLSLGNYSLYSQYIVSELASVEESYLHTKFVPAVLQRRTSEPQDLYHATRGILESLLRRGLPSVRTARDANRELAMNLLEVTGSLNLIEKAAESSMRSPCWVVEQPRNRTRIFSNLAHIGSLDATFMSKRPKGVVMNRPRLQPPESLVVDGVHLHTITSIHALQPTKTEYKIFEHEIHLDNYWIMHDLIAASNKKVGTCYERVAHVDHTISPMSTLSSIVTPELILFLDSVWRYKASTDLNAVDLVAYVKHFIPGKDDVDMSPIFATPVEACPWPASWPDPVIRLFRVHMEMTRLIRELEFTFFRASIRSDYVGPLWSWINTDCYGICTKYAEIGDEIVLIEGLPVPFIMRPFGNKYGLVSLAYVFNMMQGQAWEFIDKLGRKPVYVHNRQHQITIVDFCKGITKTNTDP